MAYLKTKDQKIYYNYVKNGSKPVFVFVHGWLANWTVFKKEIQHFKKNYSVLYLDLQGHGKSSSPKNMEDYSIEKMQGVLKEVLKKEKIKSIILVGHSMGGMVSMMFTLKNPSIVSKLILISTADKNPLAATRIKILKKNRKLIEKASIYIAANTQIHKTKEDDFDFTKLKNMSDINIAIPSIANTGFHTLIYTLTEMFSFNVDREISNIKCPTLVIQGDDDSLFSKGYAARMAKKIRNAEINVEKGKHFIELERPNQIIETIEKFLE